MPVAIADAISEGGESLPIILDDPFIATDDTRFAAAMRHIIETLGPQRAFPDRFALLELLPDGVRRHRVLLKRWRAALMTSCKAPASAGMSLSTRSATALKGRAAAVSTRDRVGTVSHFSSELAKNSRMRRGASTRSSALRDGGVSTMTTDRKSTRLNSSHIPLSRMPSSA